MKERMSWKGDEKLYQPRIHSKRIRELHSIAELLGKPMTCVIDQAIAEFVSRREVKPAAPPYPHVPDVDDLLKERMLNESMDFPLDDYEDLGAYLEPYQND